MSWSASGIYQQKYFSHDFVSFQGGPGGGVSSNSTSPATYKWNQRETFVINNEHFLGVHSSKKLFNFILSCGGLFSTENVKTWIAWHATIYVYIRQWQVFQCSGMFNGIILKCSSCDQLAVFFYRIIFLVYYQYLVLDMSKAKDLLC